MCITQCVRYFHLPRFPVSGSCNLFCQGQHNELEVLQRLNYRYYSNTVLFLLQEHNFLKIILALTFFVVN